MKQGFVKVAAASCAVVVADVRENTRVILETIHKMEDEGAKVMVLPELALTGYTCSDLFWQSQMIDAAKEGLKEIARMFKAIGKVEVEHEKEYLELKEALIAEGFLESDEEEEWICEVCGHVHRGKKPPKECPLCRVEKEYFKKKSKDVTAG